MLELGVGADILRALGWLYLGLMALLIGVALWFPQRWWQKVIGTLVVLMIFAGPAYLRSRERAQLADEHKARYEKAKAIFDERCKTAGEKIYKTVDEVEGVLLLNVRTEYENADGYDPRWVNAGLPEQVGGDGYIYSFIGWENQFRPPARGSVGHSPDPKTFPLSFPGYTFVDVRQEDGSISRYQRSPSPPKYMNRKAIEKTTARYAVSFSNDTNEADRANWIAGTTVTVTDVQSNRVVAEKTWFSFEPSLGRRAPASRPWGYAITCPEVGSGARYATRFFVDQVLKPKRVE